MNKNIQGDFQIYVSVPLNDKEHGKSENEGFQAFERVVKSFWQMLGSPIIWERRKKISLRNFETGKEIKS